MWERADIALTTLEDEIAIFGESETDVIERFAKCSAEGALKRGAQGPLSIGTEVE